MITPDQINNTTAPFNVRNVKSGRVSTITGFSENDPLGVGGYADIIPDMATAYFESGAWVLVADLMRHFEMTDLPKSPEST